MLKILSWNIQQGGGSRIKRIVESIINLSAEIVVISEFRNNDSGRKIRHLLLEGGYRYQFVTGAIRNNNAVAIFSKIPSSSNLYAEADPTYGHNIVEAKFSAFNVIGVYMPHKKKHRLLSFITELVKKSDVPYIIAGDYNTGKNYIDQRGNSFWYEDELLKLEKTGYMDAFRLISGEVKEYSWFSHQGNGYRYDHTYVDDSIKGIVKDCYYLHAWRQDKLSDHSPMVLVLG